MKILLQDMKTGLYLSRGGCWSDNPNGAPAFLNEVRAQDFVIYRRLPDAKMVVLTETGTSELPLTTLASAAKANVHTKPIMNTKANTPQTSKLTPRKRSRPGPAKVTLLAQQIPVTFEETTRREPASGRSLRRRNSAQAEQATVVEAKIDVGLGNMLFIRGQGDGLNWFEGVPLNCVDATTWVWSTRQVREKVVFKLLLNDQVWAKGEDVVSRGEQSRTDSVVSKAEHFCATKCWGCGK